MSSAPWEAPLTAARRVGAASDAERRLAVQLRDELAAEGWEVSLEPFWCRPNWPAAHAWHVLLAVVGSLVAASTSPRAGGLLVLLALAFLLADWLTGVSPGRWLTPLRASQNVIAVPAAAAHPPGLILTAALDSPREGIATAPRLRALATRVSAKAGGRLPGWSGWLALLQLWLLVVLLLRADGSTGLAVKIAQLLPTILLVLALAALLELAAAPPALEPPHGGAALGAALTAARHLKAGALPAFTPRLVLQGAGDAQAIGLRRHLKAARSERGRPSRPLAVLALVALPGAATRRGPAWLAGCGPLVPLRPHPSLAAAVASAAREVPELEAQGLRRSIATPALPAHLARIPALTLAARAPASAASTAPPAAVAVAPAAAAQAAELALLLVEVLATRQAQPRTSRARSGGT